MLVWLPARLAADGRPHRLVSGSWEERLGRAAAAVERLAADGRQRRRESPGAPKP